MVRTQALPFVGASRILGIAGWVPDQVVSSSELERKLSESAGLPKLSIESRTGVRERRVRDPSMGITDMAMQAVNQAMERAWVAPQEVDLVIYAGVSREHTEPATATLIHERLGLSGAAAFDVSDACLGFIDAWCIADAMIASGRSRVALIVSAEAGSVYTQAAMHEMSTGAAPKEHFASLTLGDGAAAAVLVARDRTPGSVGLTAGIRESHGEHNRLCVIPKDGEPMRTKPNALIEAALSRFAPLAKQVLDKSGWSVSDVDLAVSHQASLDSIYKGCEILGLDSSKAAVSMDRFGNMASVSVPFTLAEAIDQGRVGPGSKILIAGFGSGLGMGMLTLQL